MLICIVEDNASARDTLSRLLRAEGFEVVAFSNALDAMSYLDTSPPPDLMLIDFRLEGGPNGTTLAARTRNKAPQVAIVMMSEFASKREIVTAFKIPVDDYLVRPFETHELLHAISEAMMKYRSPAAQATQTIGGLELDIGRRHASWYGTDLKLTRTEFIILSQLATHPGDVMSYSELLALAKGERVGPAEARNRLKTHLTNLKRKLQEAGPGHASPIRTRHSAGFVWETGGEMTDDAEGEA